VSEPSVPGAHGAIFGDTRDITPFREGRVRTSVSGLAEGLSDAIAGILKGKTAGRIEVAGDVPKVKRLAGKTAKSVYDAVFTSTEPDRLITLARAYQGWAGLCYVIAGLLAYKHGGYLRASELLQRGLSIRIDDAASQFSASYLGRVVTRVEVAERIAVPVLFSEESVFLALSHCFRETGQTAEALDILASLPPSLPSALARCTAAAALERHSDVVDWTEGLRNADDLSAALLLIRAQSLRILGEREGAQAALAEVLRRKKTSLALRNDALTDRALSMLEVGLRAPSPRPLRTLVTKRVRPGTSEETELEAVDGIRKDVEVRRLWNKDFDEPGG
jgi:tetratricopeptide (TPR) repeat protein